MNFDLDFRTDRRQALKVGGLSVTLAALVAACGENRGGDDAPGRVGNAPVVTSPPDYPVDDIVLLRTASSLEYTIIAAYEEALSLDGAVPQELVAMMERLIENHHEIGEQMVALTEAAGGEGWTCPNTWFTDRLVDPTFEKILSNAVGVVVADGSGKPTQVQVLGDTVDIAPTVATTLGELTLLSSSEGVAVGDELEFSRLEGAVSGDAVAFAQALESLAVATHQELASATSIVDARIAHVEAATLEARHSGALAIALYGSDGYVSPALVGEDVPPTERAQIRHFAVDTTFGQTAQIEVKAGPSDFNAVRTSVVLQTPSDNSFVYNELTCEA